MQNNSIEISKTALIPLWARAKALKLIETNKAEWALANELLDKLDFDYNPLNNLNIHAQRLTIFDIAIRSIIINGIIDKLDTNHTIINIGAGYDLKSQLFQNRFDEWLNYDLENIIAIRNRLFPNEKNMIMNILDVNSIANQDIRKPVFILEGLLMYFEKEISQTIIQNLVHYYPDAKFIIEVGGSWIKYTNHPAFAKLNIKTNYLWGINNIYEFKRMYPMLKINEYLFIINQYPKIWGQYSKYFKILPIIKSKFGSQIVYASC